jgi:hypothetical protein
MVVDATYDISAAQCSQALRGIQGIDETSFTVTPFYPESFLIQCRSPATRDLILGATTLPVQGTRLVTCPWTRLAHADASSFKFIVALELEGIPPHVWAEDTAAKILGSACWIHAVDQQTLSK